MSVGVTGWVGYPRSLGASGSRHISYASGNVSREWLRGPGADIPALFLVGDGEGGDADPDGSAGSCFGEFPEYTADPKIVSGHKPVSPSLTYGAESIRRAARVLSAT